MSSSTMPPPLHPRRTHRLNIKSLTPPTSPESAKCVLRKMSLSKGATFHHSSSPPAEDDPALSIPHLARRSPTCSSATLTSWLADKEDVAKSIADFEQTFSGARGKKSSTRRRSALNFTQDTWVRRVSTPSDEGIGSSISSAGSDKGLARSFERALDLLSNKDSGLGTSISDSAENVVGRASEDDGLVKDLIQEADSPEPTSHRLRLRGAGSSSRSSSTITSSAVTQSIAPQPRRASVRRAGLSTFSRNKINEHIFSPILEEDRFTRLHPLVTALTSRNNKTIRCLRDLEQSLIFQPLTLAISQQLYRSFGEFTIQLVADTYQQISESEQRRAADRPYDNGYFLDLVQQVHRLASHIGSSSTNTSAEEDDDMAYDEITLEGGLDQTGNLAELVRWKNGQGTSLRTNQPYVPTAGLKRQSSAALDEDVARSMARRKKGYIPEVVELPCSDPDCDKTFSRHCDLSKHEKTHSRPFKCPDEKCKYHKLGLPTEKERERHYNDKHSNNPTFYKCDFCEFKTKRESNCKQHMEKKHNWHYERAKGKDKATAGSSRMTPMPTPQTPSLEYTPSPAISVRTWDDTSSISASLNGSTSMTPFDQPLHNFDMYQQPPVTYSNPIFPRATQPMQYTNDLDEFDFNTSAFTSFPNAAQAYISPTTSASASNSNMMTTPITPAYSNITEPSPFSTSMDFNMDSAGNAWNAAAYQTPDSMFKPTMSTGMPQGDFALFSGHSPFSNEAAASATLFPSLGEDPDAYAALDNDPIWNEEEFFNYDMTNN